MKKFEYLGDAVCLEFLSTLRHAGGEDPGEDLSSDPDVAAWAAQAGILSASEADSLQARVSRNCFQLRLQGKKYASLTDNARALRESLRQMFRRARRDGDVAPRDVETLNRLLAQLPAAGRIERSNGDWTMSWDSQAGGVERMFHAIVTSAAGLVATGRWRALRECASTTCIRMFLDTSRNHSRRWCVMALCGNRDRVRRFRARSRSARPRKAVRL